MPVAEFPGRFGWGYDGVNLFAPTQLYGTPDDLRRFVDRAHALGLGVILDVVYNHLGPDGNYLREFSAGLLHRPAPDRLGRRASTSTARLGAGARVLPRPTPRYWIDEFHLDGLRLDATQSIFDDVRRAHPRRDRHAGARGGAADARRSSSPRTSRSRRAWSGPSERGGYGLDALWNDDFHHTAMVALTGKREAYYTDYRGTPQELISAAKWGYLYQGQRYTWQQQRRGTPALDLPPGPFVAFIENHDQVANSARGQRVHQLTSPGRYRAMTALPAARPGHADAVPGTGVRLLARRSSTSPTTAGELGAKVREGRAEFLTQFPSIAAPEMLATLPDPADPRDVRALQARLRGARTRTQSIYALHRDLLRLRRRDPVFRAQRPHGVDGAVLGPEAFVLRFFGERGTERDGGADRLLVVNLGVDLALDPAPEPLLAPPAGHALARPVVERRRGLRRRRASRPSRRDTTGAFPATPPSCSRRCPRQRRTIRRAARARRPRKRRRAASALRRLGTHLVPAPLRSLTSAGESVREAAARPRVAGDQRPRRLRRRARWRACRRGAITACSSPRCPRRSGAW